MGEKKITKREPIDIAHIKSKEGDCFIVFCKWGKEFQEYQYANGEIVPEGTPIGINLFKDGKWEFKLLEGIKITGTHKETTHGWTGQESRCNFAGWWDCSFFCNKLSTPGNIVPCNLFVPDFEKCKQVGKNGG